MFKFQAKSLEQDYMQTSGSALLKLMQNNDTPVLDLFACETGSILATVSYLLGNELDKISPFITKRIELYKCKRSAKN